MRRRVPRSRPRRRKGNATPKFEIRTRVAIGVLALAMSSVFLLSVYAAVGRGSHPEPRPGVTADAVVPGDAFEHGHVRDVYVQAAGIPGILDGLFCYCRWRRQMGHRSLLSCFESMHGATCAVCLKSAEIAHQSHASGEDLSTIRSAIDAVFAPGLRFRR